MHLKSYVETQAQAGYERRHEASKDPMAQKAEDASSMQSRATATVKDESVEEAAVMGLPKDDNKSETKDV